MKDLLVLPSLQLPLPPPLRAKPHSVHLASGTAERVENFGRMSRNE